MPQSSVKETQAKYYYNSGRASTRQCVVRKSQGGEAKTTKMKIVPFGRRLFEGCSYPDSDRAFWEAPFERFRSCLLGGACLRAALIQIPIVPFRHA